MFGPNSYHATEGLLVLVLVLVVLLVLDSTCDIPFEDEDDDEDEDERTAHLLTHYVHAAVRLATSASATTVTRSSIASHGQISLSISSVPTTAGSSLTAAWATAS